MSNTPALTGTISNPVATWLDPVFNGPTANVLNPVGVGINVTYDPSATQVGHAVFGSISLTCSAGLTGSAFGVVGAGYNNGVWFGDFGGVLGEYYNDQPTANSLGVGLWGIARGYMNGTPQSDVIRATVEVLEGSPRTYLAAWSPTTGSDPTTGIYLGGAQETGIQIGGSIVATGPGVTPAWFLKAYDQANLQFAADRTGNIVANGLFLGAKENRTQAMIGPAIVIGYGDTRLCILACPNGFQINNANNTKPLMYLDTNGNLYVAGTITPNAAMP